MEQNAKTVSPMSNEGRNAYVVERLTGALLALLKEHDIPFAILGNPFHLTDEVCMRLKGYGCRKYQLSLAGMR